MYNSPTGRAQSTQYNESRRVSTIQYGMNDYLLQLLYPQLQTRLKSGVSTVIPQSLVTNKPTHHGKEFTDVIRSHFRLKKEQILIQVHQWLNECTVGINTNTTNNNANASSNNNNSISNTMTISSSNSNSIINTSCNVNST